MEGVRILEVAEHTFTPLAAGILADWGATVIKIEHVERGDAMRGLGSISAALFHRGRTGEATIVEWSPVQDTVSIAEDPMVQENGYLLETVSQEGVPFRMVSTPVMFDKEQRTPGRAPGFNEHGDEILARELGLDDEAIIALKIAGIIP